MEELDDIREFELALAERRHKEVLEMMNKLLQEVISIKDKNDNTEVNVEVDTSKLEKIVEKINSAPPSTDIPASIKAMTKVLEKYNKEIKFPEPVRKWKHTINRDSQGLYDEIISEAID